MVAVASPVWGTIAPKSPIMVLSSYTLYLGMSSSSDIKAITLPKVSDPLFVCLWYVIGCKSSDEAAPGDDLQNVWPLHEKEN